MKIWKKILIVLGVLVLSAGVMAWDAFYSAPSRFNIRYETLSSVYIPGQMDDVSILFFTDLDYGPYMDEARLKKLVETINGLAPDVVVFGGDLTDSSVKTISASARQALTENLTAINAPLGKFAVYGDNDCLSKEKTTATAEILYAADFEILTNASVKLRNTGSESVALVGLGNGINVYQDVSAAYANVPRTAYAITVCHTPDTAAVVPSDITKYFLAGHSLGGQVYWFFNSLYKPAMTDIYFRGKYTVNGTFTLDISSGTGTTGRDVRFLSNAEVVLYRLEHKVLTESGQ